MLAFYKYILTLVLDIQKLYIYIYKYISIYIYIYIYLSIYIYIYIYSYFELFRIDTHFLFQKILPVNQNNQNWFPLKYRLCDLFCCCLHRANKNKSWIQFVKLLVCTICIVKLNNTFALFKNASLILNKISQNQVWPS